MSILDKIGDFFSKVRGQERTYTVVAGDTLSGISLKYYDDPNQYMKIFQANKDLLNDPDKIYPGQVLKIPK